MELSDNIVTFRDVTRDDDAIRPLRGSFMNPFFPR
jgi:hypothetical protein